jgi:hypothetical protein
MNITAFSKDNFEFMNITAFSKDNLMDKSIYQWRN